MGGFMLLIVYTKIYATYKGNKCERTFLLSGICSIHTAKEPANVLKKFNAGAKISWISNILNKYQTAKQSVFLGIQVRPTARAVKQKVWKEGRMRLARFARVRVLRHASPISLLILRKKPDCFAV